MTGIPSVALERVLPFLRRIGGYLSGRVGRKWHRSFRLRILVQSAFAVTCLGLGVQFARFVAAAKAGVEVLPQRPPGVEGFLPIGGLLGIIDWVHQGTLNVVHPAATVLLLVFLAMALLARKSFCSWVCPVGFLSDLFARVGRFFFGRNFRIWKGMDWPLRSLKYLLLGFFVWAISRMPADAIRAFIESPYYRLSDVRMGMFFLELSGFAAGVIALTAAGSILWKGFWCRYLCPYGAMLGLVSWLSPLKVRRDPVSCIDCGLCDKACASRLPVSRKTAITSVECTGCLDCVAACPVEDALGVGLPSATGLAGLVRRTGQEASRRPRWLSVPTYAAAILALFFAGYLGARAAGTWDNGISDAEYRWRLGTHAVELYGHPGIDGRVPSGHGRAASR